MAKDVKMLYIEDDIKKIQTKTNLYIQQYGPQGAFHLAREIIQNSIDEVIDPESNGSSIYISYDILSDKLTCEDDGRGFPETDYSLDIFFTRNQSGSKFFRDQGGDSAGEFGVGATVVNALSDVFEVTNFREVEKVKHTIIFNEGEIVSDKTTKLPKNKPHGSIVSFIPSKKFLGKNTVIPYKEMVEWVKKMCYFITKKNVRVKIDIFKGLKLKETYKFKPIQFEDLLDEICTNKKFSPKCKFSGDDIIEEEIRVTEEKKSKITVKEKKMKKKMHLDVALRYVPESITYFDSYCNYTNTTEGGVHQSAVEKCFCNFMQQKTKAAMSEAQRAKTPITWDDVREGLCCVINLTTNAQVGFVGNSKEKIGNEALTPHLSKIVNDGLEQFFKKNTGVLNDYIRIIRLNAKARVEASKVKAATQKEKMNWTKEYEMKNYIKCTNKGKQWKELFITEGDSAAGSARNGSDTKTQAFFLLRGVVANAFKQSLAELMDPKTGNREWRDLVTILRCGIGKSFDAKKLYFNRINILTDQDIDGFYISSLILAFFYRYMPEIIEQGYLYKVFTPLYALTDKDKPFVTNKHEMVSIYHKKLSKVYKVKFANKKKYATKEEFQEFLTDTYDYSENLSQRANDMGYVNKFLLESILANMVLGGVIDSSFGELEVDKANKKLDKVFGDQKFVKYLMSRLQKKFKELVLNDKSRTISGIINGKRSSIKITSRFIRRSIDLLPIYEKYGYEIEVSEKGKDPVVMTIGEFLDAGMKYYSKIIRRFKGLGEINGKDLFDTALDINHRVSIQYTLEDAEKELEIFNMLNGPSKKDLEKRKKLMSEYKIKRDDLDN